ncbi:hypothetical protein [Erwinia sp. E_sp_W01_6]
MNAKEMFREKCLIVILNWNGSSDTLSCCESLMQSEGNFDVLIIDNSSSAEQYKTLIDGLNKQAFENKLNITYPDNIIKNYNIDLISTFYANKSNYYVFHSTINHGFAKGCNLGAEFSSYCGYESVLF